MRGKQEEEDREVVALVSTSYRISVEESLVLIVRDIVRNRPRK